MKIGRAMIQKFIIAVTLISTTLLTSCTIGSDDDESFYYANNNKFFANTRKSCQSNSIFDIDYFKCRLCDGNFHLMATRQKNQCSCDRNSTEVFEYDNILRRPICEKRGGEKETEIIKCSIRFVNATKFSSVRKSVRIFRLPSNEKCWCDTKNNENYRGDYCIKQELLKDLKNYQNYRHLPLTQTLNLNYELKFIVFFCKVLHRRDYCNYLANLCVLTHYDLDKNSPCYTFYQQQSQQQLSNIDEGGNSYGGGTNEGNEFDGGEKMKPFLFFRGRRSNKNLFDKFIDFSYNINNANSTINFTILNYNLHGNLSELRAMKLSDIDLCNQYTAHAENIKFARNFFSKCTINLREYVALKPDMRFSTLYLNYYENQANFVQTVPILVRNAFKVNEFDDVEKWQLVKRFYLIDTVSGMSGSGGKNGIGDEHDDESKFYEQYSQINYVKSIEMRFHLSDDDENSDEINRINIPLLIIEYGSLNLTQIAQTMKSSSNADERQLYNIEFYLKIKFTKRPNLNFFFQIILPIFILIAFFNALMSTFFYKISQQKLEYDLSILLNFIISLMANISNAFFIFILIFIGYVYFVYKLQSTAIKIMLPIEREESMIEVLLVFAIIFKVVKLLKLFFDMISLDIFFIDWERPKAFNTSDHFLHGSNKSHPGTPSITSSFKPTFSASPSPTNECVSAWRNYFVANEWQELITKRKISVQLHVIFVIAVLMLFDFESLSSADFGWFLNAKTDHNHRNTNNEAVADIVYGNTLLKVATGAMIYLFIYVLQRIWNFLIYERFIDNCLQQFVDVASIANISVLILINNYGFYVHGRSVHGRSDIDTFNMILQFKREEENLCGNRGLLPSSDQQTYTILAPRNLRLFYEKLISPIQSNKNIGNHYHQQFNKFEQNFEKTMVTYHNINRFFAAFIDHALKDVDYMIKEKNLFEKLFDCELESSTINNESKGIFYIDNGHSFDKVLFYGNENTIFGFEFLMFIFLLFTTGNFLIATLSIGVVFKVITADDYDDKAIALIELVINHLTKNNLARKTLIDKRFLI